jgi:hypothetical protein
MRSIENAIIIKKIASAIKIKIETKKKKPRGPQPPLPTARRLLAETIA